MEDARSGGGLLRRTIRFRPTRHGRPSPPRRTAVGLQLSSDGSRVSAAVITTAGSGLALDVDVVGSHTNNVAEEAATLVRQMLGGADKQPARLGLLSAQLADTLSTALAEGLRQCDTSPDEVLVVGVDEPGLWAIAEGGVRGYCPLVDSVRLAESSGQNIVDAFPLRDLAQGGQGGPIAALAQWIVLGDPTRTRVLLDLGRSTRLTYLPSQPAGGASRVLSFDVGPGTAVLDRLVQQLTGGEQSFDSGGHLAVQGHCLDELIEHWLADPYFSRPLPRWHPQGVAAARFLGEAMQMAMERDWAVRDLLCTATHFIAQIIATAILRQLPRMPVVEEILVVGGGRHNGLLLRELEERLPEVALVRPSQFGPAASALEPASAAVLALLHLDQTPANHMAITGAHAPRVLGRLTPGSPQRWSRLVRQLADALPSAVPLRSAV